MSKQSVKQQDLEVLCGLWNDLWEIMYEGKSAVYDGPAANGEKSERIKAQMDLVKYYTYQLRKEMNNES
jgi:hypothetical protein